MPAIVVGMVGMLFWGSCFMLQATHDQSRHDKSIETRSIILLPKIETVRHMLCRTLIFFSLPILFLLARNTSTKRSVCHLPAPVLLTYTPSRWFHGNSSRIFWTCREGNRSIFQKVKAGVYSVTSGHSFKRV